ncbi:MAG: ABC transporter permease [Calditrichia bacterium]
MQRIIHMIRKEFRQIFRDKPMVVIIFIAPLIQLFVLSYAITTNVTHIKLTIADFDRSAVSRSIIRDFSHTERFDLIGYTSDIRQIGQEMRAWKTQFALVIPENFSKNLKRKLEPQIQAVVDGVDGNTAGVALGYAQEILSRYGASVMTNPGNSSRNSKRMHLVTMLDRMWYNLNLDSKEYMVPGIVVILLTIIPMMLSAMSLVKEKEIGTLEQLMVTPLRKHQLLIGKIIPFLILSYVEMAVVMNVAILFFHITMNGSFILLAFLSFLYLLTTIGLGIFISTFTNTQQQAMFVAWFFMVFMILMSGFFIPIDNMPQFLKALTYLNPMRYFMYIIRDIFEKGAGLHYLWKDAVPMTVFGLLIITMGVLKFRKRIG